MSAHTPGPWVIEARHKTAINAGDKHVAMVNFWNHPDPKQCINEEEHQANVHLIAAAPELLAALENFVSIAEDYMPDWCIPALLKAEAAINKAKGIEK